RLLAAGDEDVRRRMASVTAVPPLLVRIMHEDDRTRVQVWVMLSEAKHLPLRMVRCFASLSMTRNVRIKQRFDTSCIILRNTGRGDRIDPPRWFGYTRAR